jgi:beta-N-acetylhexosaminidase
MTLGPLMVDVAGQELTAEDREILAHPLVGSVILFTRNYAEPGQLQRLAAAIHAVRSPPLLVAVDHEGGRVQRFRNGFTSLPPLRLIGHQFDLDRNAALRLARQHGWLMAAELLACGIDFSFAPCVDLDYGLSEIIGDRSFHSRGEVVGELAVSYMHGMRDAGMAATAKHFPGHGAVVADSHLALPVDRREYTDLEDDLTPYRRLIANNLPAVMVAHVLFPQVDSRPASLSRRWIGGVLREELRFGGAVYADDLSMAGAASFGDIVARAAEALAAGCDVIPVCNSRPSVVRLLDGLKLAPDPASHLRQARMRAQAHEPRDRLLASDQWRQCREALEQCTKPPPLKFA